MSGGDWFFGVRKKVEGVLGKEFPIRHAHFVQSKERLPPRFMFKGISVAARVVGHEIRNFTKRTTGKDLACIRESKRRQDVLNKLSEIRVAVSNKETKYNLLTLACNHSTNFTSTLSLEDTGYSRDSDFDKNNLHEFIAQYHKQCIKHENTLEVTHDEVELMRHSRAAKRHIGEKKYDSDLISQCRCYAPTVEEKKRKNIFLSCWEHKGISEDELDRYYLENILHFDSSHKKEGLNLADAEGWKEFLRNDQCIVFRKKLPDGLYEYRVQASFSDVSAKNLFTTQLDSEYRKQWDGYVVDLSVVDSDQSTSSELVHWVTKCPYPFSTREYIYLRRKKVDEGNKALILCQQATDQTDIPRDTNIFRVETYVSKIIIKPHEGDFDKNGCDFLLTYYDDPKMRLPARVLDMAASKGISDSVTRMYQAALGLQNNNEEKPASHACESC